MQSESILILLRFPVVYRDNVMPTSGGEATQHQGAVHGDPIQALGDDKATTEADGTSCADVPRLVQRDPEDDSRLLQGQVNRHGQ